MAEPPRSPGCQVEGPGQPRGHELGGAGDQPGRRLGPASPVSKNPTRPSSTEPAESMLWAAGNQFPSVSPRIEIARTAGCSAEAGDEIGELGFSSADGRTVTPSAATYATRSSYQ